MVAVLAGLAAAGTGGWARAADDEAIAVTIQDHKFMPAEIHVPAGKPATLKVENKDSSAEEFDSSALKVEKVIAGGHTAVIHLRPLEKGRYKFMGEYHEATAQGVVIAE